jgi:fructose-bisphosphate aldolase class I
MDMNLTELNKIAEAMVASHKGLLAADESTGTIKRRFDSINLTSTEDARRDYREMLFRAEGLGKYISGVILYDETLRQSAKDGTKLAEVLVKQNILPGIKVDAGAVDLPGSPKEKITEGLDGLPARIAEYAKLGAKFAKWRAVIDIAEDIPTPYCVHTNAHALARYARICQEGGIVPIVEPEVLMDGAHDIDRCAEVTEYTLNAVFRELQLLGVALEGMILKPNMVIAGKKSAKQASIDEVAKRTVITLKRCVPSAVPGVMFLSGGQSEADATAHLNAMNGKFGPLPWKLSYSYGRALQDSALKTWAGKSENVAAAQKRLLQRSQHGRSRLGGKGNGRAENRAVDPVSRFRAPRRRGACDRRGWMRLRPYRRHGWAFRAEHVVRSGRHQGHSPAYKEDIRRSSDDRSGRAVSRRICGGRCGYHHRASRSR